MYLLYTHQKRCAILSLAKLRQIPMLRSYIDISIAPKILLKNSGILLLRKKNVTTDIFNR